MFNPFLKLLELSHLGRPNHYFVINGYKICARCFGMTIAYLLLLPIVRFFPIEIENNLTIVIPAALLAIICFINWMLGKFYEMSNMSRFISGILLGIAISIFTLLPDRRIMTIVIMPIVAIAMLSVIAFKKYRIVINKEVRYEKNKI